MLVRIGVAAKLQGVSASTLRRWEKEERMAPACRTRGGHRRYKLREINREKDAIESKVVVGYARVSGAKQRKDLKKQQEQIKNFAEKQGWEMKRIYSDIASGMNEQRKGLLRLLNEVATTHPHAVICTYEDRIARFGTKVIKHYCEIFETKVKSIYQQHKGGEENKLMEDMIALVTSFAGRLHRQRRGKAPPTR